MVCFLIGIFFENQKERATEHPELPSFGSNFFSSFSKIKNKFEIQK